MTVESDIKEIVSDKKIIAAFSGKKVLVTGANGLIGSMLIRALEYANRKYDANISIIGYARNKKRVQKILGEICNSFLLIDSDDFNITTPCDFIFHTASPTSSRFFIEKPVETIDTILFGTKAMLELAKKNRATMIYLSSMEEYGTPYSPGELMSEEKIGIIDHLSVRSCYPEGKRMCECMCMAYASEYAVPVKIVRLAQTFGAGMPLSDNRVPMQFAKSVKDKRNIILHTEGKSISNYCYLSDAISGILTIAACGKNGEAYNVCNDKETRSIYSIAKLVSKQVANDAIKVVRDIPNYTNMGYAPDNTMRLSSQKIRELGWEPKVSMVEGYRRLVDYLSDAENER